MLIYLDSVTHKRVSTLGLHSLKRKCRHFDEILITGCTGSCHFDNFQCNQWWKFHQNEDISVSVLLQLMTYRLVGTKPLPEPMLTYLCDPYKQNLAKSNKNATIFNQRNLIWKCRLQNIFHAPTASDHFVHAPKTKCSRTEANRNIQL